MGIWDIQEYKNLIPKEFHLTLGEGNTPISIYRFENQDLLVKEEFRNPNASFKDRSMAFWISKLKFKNAPNAVISSSGNAAISAAAYCNQAGIGLDIFVSERIEEKKLQKLEEISNKSAIIHKSKTPKSDAVKFAKENNFPNLRGSQEEDAVVGFKSLAYELFEQNRGIDALFIPCSSGTSALGVYLGYMDILKNDPTFKLPALHICQTSKVSPIAKEFDSDFMRRYSSLAPAISDRIALRKDTIIEIVKRTHGWGWVISDDDLKSALELSKELGIEFESYNSVLSLAGFLKSRRKGYKYNSPCLVYSGT